jgi:amino acid transporter
MRLAMESAPKLFVRQSSGLVRAANTYDAAVFNLMYGSMGIVIAWIVGFIPGFYPGASPYWSIVLCLLIGLPINLIYGMFATIMPRAGGDYVFISRGLHPAVGFMANAGYSLFLMTWMAAAGSYFTGEAVGSTLRIIAMYTGNMGLVEVANWFWTPWGMFLSSSVLLVLFAMIFIYGQGVRTYVAIQRWTFILAMAGVAAIMLTVLSKGEAGIRAGFDSYVLALGGVSDGSAVAAGATGYEAAGFSWRQTMLSMSWTLFLLSFCNASAYFAGEIRTGRRVHLLSMPFTGIVGAVVMLIAVSVSHGTMGDFFAVINNVDPAALGLGVIPSYAEVAAASAGNIVLALLCAWGYGLWFLIWIPMDYVIESRNVFAWALDGVVPEALARVDERTGSPVNATLFIMVVGILMAALWSFSQAITMITGILGLEICLALTGIAGILFPYRRPDLFESSPVNWRLGGVPVMSIAGALAAAAALFFAYIVSIDGNSGVAYESNPTAFWVSLAVFPALLAVYYISSAMQKSRGIDLSLVAKELPPD